MTDPHPIKHAGTVTPPGNDAGPFIGPTGLPYELSSRKNAPCLRGLSMSSEQQVHFAAAVEALVSEEATHRLVAAAVGAIRFEHPDVMTVDFEVHPRPTYVFARAEITLRGPGGWVWDELSTPELAAAKSTKAVWDHLVTVAAALPLPFADPAQVARDPTVGVDHDVSLTAYLHECQLSGMINVIADPACFAPDSDLDFSPR